MTDTENKYWAFLSYSHQDNCEHRPDTQEVNSLCWGNWLHDALKTFSIPAEFIGQINARGEVIPERIHPVFQDEQELPGDAGLGADIRQALDRSVCLIVVCSPRSAQSLHVNETVRYFKELGRGRHILPIVVAGEPNASDENKPGSSAEDECFVPALRYPLRPDGTLDTTRRAGRFIFVDARHGAEKREILAKDDRNAEADLEMAKIQLIALVIGVGFNGLWWREQKRHFFEFAEARHAAREALNQAGEARRQLQEAQRQVREAQDKALEMQNLPRDVHGQIQEAQNRAQEAQDQAREAQKQLQEIQNKVRDTQSQLEEARSRALAAESKLLEAQHQAREFQNRLEETRNQAREAQNKVLETITPRQDIPNQIVEAQNQVLEAQNLVQNTQGQLEETLKQAQDAQSRFLEAQSQVQELQNQARSAQSQLEAAHNQVREAQSKVLEAQNQAREAQSKFQELQNQTRDVQSQIQEAQNQVQNLQNKSRNARRLTRVFALLAVLAMMAADFAARIAQQQRTAARLAIAKTAAAEAGMFYPGPGELDLEQIRQALLQIGGAEQQANRLRSLDKLAAWIPQAEIPEALRDSSLIMDDRQRSHFQKWLLVRLGWVNPQSAMTNASAIEGTIVNDEGGSDTAIYFQLAVLDNWMRTDLPEAFNWVRRLPDADSRHRAMEKIIRDPVLAIQLQQQIAAMPADDDQKVAIRMLLSIWAPADPEAAVNWLCSFPETNAQPAQVQSVIKAWSQREPAAAAQWLAKLPAGTASEGMVSAFLDGAVEKYPEFAAQWTQSITDETERQKFQMQVARQWMNDDPSAALTWINSLNFTEEIMRPQLAPWPWTKFLLNSNFGGLIIFPVETELLSNATTGPIQIKPEE